MAESLYTSSTPVVKVDGNRVAEVARDLLRLEVEEDTGGLRTLTLHVVASAPPADTAQKGAAQWLDGKVFDFGKKVSVVAGPPTKEFEVFVGVVSAIEVSFEEGDVPHVTVRAEDALMPLRMTQRSRTFTKVSEADLVRQLAGEHSLTPDVSVNGPTYDVVQQANESDLAFLRRRLALVAAELWVTDRTLHAATRDQRRGPAVKLVRGSTLLDVNLRADLAHQCTSVRVSGYDASQRDRIDADAPSSTIQSEVSGGRTGPQTLERALGALPGRRSRLVPLKEAEARDWAKGEMLRRSRGFVTAMGVTSGTPDMTVGSRVELRGVGGPFDGEGYYATCVRHVFDVTVGLRTHFEAERATVNEGAA